MSLYYHEGPGWKTCEIHLKKINTWDNIYIFEIEIIPWEGPRYYGIEKSERFQGRHAAPTNTDYEAGKTLLKFVFQLEEQGWEMVDSKGAAWYSHRFRRRVEE